MNLDYVKNQRGLPFVKRGMRVELSYQGKTKQGLITGGNQSGNLQIKFDGEKKTQNCHPRWAMTYFADDGRVIESFPE